MKIGLVIPALVQQGGGERQILYLAKGLVKNGYEVIIYTINYDKERCYPDLAHELNIKSLYNRSHRAVKLPPFLALYLSYINLCLNLKKISRMVDRGTDIINVHGEGIAWLILRLMPEWRGKFIWTCNDSPAWIEVFKKRDRDRILHRFKNFLDRTLIYRFISYYDKKAVQNIDEIVVLSKKMKQSLENYYGKGGQCRVNLLRGGIDLTKFEGGDGALIRKRYGIKSQDFLLIHVSLLQPLRRIEDVILAISLLKDDYTCLKMLIVGNQNYNPQYVQGLKKLIKAKSLDEGIILAGEVPDQELPLYYRASDGFVFPSDGRQSWGLVVFEAMAGRRPVIVSRFCGASEVLRDEKEALFITPGDISGIAGQIKRLIEDEELRKRLAEGGYNFVKENLSWSNYVQGMEEIFLATAR